LILFDVSVSVIGVPYPIALPAPATTFCNINSEVKHVYTCVYECTRGYEKAYSYCGYVNWINAPYLSRYFKDMSQW
jgi:hypothetical protein